MLGREDDTVCHSVDREQMIGRRRFSYTSMMKIDELENLGEVEPWGDIDSKFKDAIAYETPSLEDYFALLEKGIASRGCLPQPQQHTASGFAFYG